MADKVPRSRFSFLDIHTVRWLRMQWQVLRRHRDYPAAVQRCRAEIAAHLAPLDPTVTAEGFTLSSLLGDLDMLNHTLHQPLPPPDKTFPPSLRGGPRQEVERQCRRLCAPAIREAVPPLAQFVQVWNFALPLDHTIAELPDFVAALLSPRDYDMRLTYGRDALVVEFTIGPEASHEALRSQLNDILAGHKFFNTRRTRHIQASDVYDEMLRVYDMRQQGWKLAAIAQEVWPNDPTLQRREQGKKDPGIQRVQNRLREFKKLMDAVVKKAQGKVTTFALSYTQ